METISLDEKQREKALDILRGLSEGDIKSPTDVVDVWETPDTIVDLSEKEGKYPEYEGFVSPARIRGTFESTIHRLEPGRLAKVLKWLIEGEFEIKNIYPPSLQKRGEQYYVTNDGHHRCIAAKAICLEELYVWYSEVPPELLEEKAEE